MGVEAFNDFVEHLIRLGELKHGQGAKEEIMGLESLMRGRNVGNNSPGNLKMSGSSTDRIAGTSIYGREGKSTVDLEIGKI